MGKHRVVQFAMGLAVTALILALFTPWIALAGERLALWPLSDDRQAGLEDSACRSGDIPVDPSEQATEAAADITPDQMSDDANDETAIPQLIEIENEPVTVRALSVHRKGPSVTSIVGGLALLGILLTGTRRVSV